MAKRNNWNAAENDAVIGLYFTMLAAVLEGTKLNKSALIRAARAGALSARSRGSVEAKLMNMTAVLDDIGRTELSLANHGYKAAPAYQAALRQQVVAACELAATIAEGIA